MNDDLRYLLNIPVRALAIGGFMFIAACSDADQPSQTSTTVATNTISKTSTAAAQLNLSTVALNQPMFLGQIVPEVQAAAPCPFLSDEDAMAIIKSKRELKRRNTSNEACYWSMNAGFSVRLTLEPLATAKPVQERAYNIDSPPVLKSQPGPGNNATVLFDTVWDKEQAYAMSFEQGQQLVMIFVTGMATDAELLTTAAHIVSDHIQAGAAIVVQAENTDEFNLCSTWSEAEIAAIIGSPITVSSGKLECKWSSGSGNDLKQIGVNVSYGKNHTWDYLREIGGIDVPGIGEGAMLNKTRKKGNRPAHVVVKALYAESLVNVSVTDNVANFNGVAVALAKNIGDRF